MSDSLQIEVSQEFEPITLLNLRGRLDAEAAQTLREQCLDLREKGRIHMVVEMSQVTFVASSGVGTLLLLAEEAKKLGGSLVYAAPSADVTRVIDLLNLDQFLEIKRSVAGAVEAIGV